MRPTTILITSLATLTLTLAACGDDDSDSGATTATATVAAATADADRYCALTRELDTEGEKFFSGLGEDASPKQYEAAERRFITRFTRELEELEQVAPQQIKRDVGTLLAGQRERAGLPSTTTVPESEGSAAESRIQAWEKRNCDS